MTPAHRWRPAAALALVLALTAVLLPSSPAAAQSSPGTVLTSVSWTLPSSLSSLATGKLISYATTDVTGAAITATGLVMTPKSGRTYKTVVWAHGTTGLADQCAPSLNYNVFWAEAQSAVAALLAKGFTVAAPDYPGLGTPQAHPYLIGGSEGRSIIDIAKSARKLDSSLSTQYAVDGHSQGGQGALFAGELASSYDGNLVLKSVSAIAPVSNAQVFAPLVPGTEGNGYLVMALYGLHAVDSSFAPNSELASSAQSKQSVLTTGCLNEILAAYAPLTASQLLVGGALPDATVTELSHYVNPAQVAPTAPVLLVQGTDDEAVPEFITEDYLLPELQAWNTEPITYLEVAGADHDAAVTDTASQVADWIAGKFS